MILGVCESESCHFTQKSFGGLDQVEPLLNEAENLNPKVVGSVVWRLLGSPGRALCEGEVWLM